MCPIRNSLVFVAAALVSVHGGARAEALRIGGTGASLGAMKALGETFTRRHPEIELIVPTNLGSTGGIKAVVAGALDIALSARPLNEREIAAGARATAFVRTPFLWATSIRTPVKALTASAFTSLIDPKTGAWPDGAPLRLILRPASDTDTHLTARYFPNFQSALAKARRVRGVRIAATDQEALDLAESAPGTLVPTSLIAVLSERRKVSPVVIDGAAPTVTNMESGAYGIVKTLYLVTAGKSSGTVRRFLTFLHSVEAKAILRRIGAIPVSEVKDH